MDFRNPLFSSPFRATMAVMLSVDFQNYFILVLACLLSTLFLFVYFIKKPKNDSHLVPSPPSLSFIEQLHLFFSVLTHPSLHKILSKYGPLRYLRIFHVPIILVSSASVAYEIFRTHDVNVSSRGPAGIDDSLVFGASGFIKAPYGEYWRFMKKLIATKVLGPQALEQSQSIRAVELERFYRKLLDKAMKKESTVIIDEALRLVNNSLYKMSLGSREDNNEVDIIQKLISGEFAALSKKISLIQTLRNPFKSLAILLFKKDIMDVSHRIDAMLERILVEHEEKLDEHQSKDILDTLLIAYRDENAEYKITRDHIKSLFSELFLGAADTSASAIQWTMAEIINRPNILKILREEIEFVVGKTRLIQETDLPNLPYLQAIVKEGLRLHPYMPLFSREFKEDCIVEGFYIPEGTRLLVNAYAIMRDPNSWEDPNEFKPERFLTSSIQAEERRHKTLKYLPFGSGRRGCPGSNLGYIFIGTAIGMMVQCFDWKIKGDKVNMQEAKRKLFVTMAHPLTCTPLLRTLSPLPSNLQIPSL